MTELLLWPFVAGLVLTGIHAWFGLHVLARKVVFVDLALAQVAALGLAVAILAGHAVSSEAAYWYAFAFAIAGAVLVALVRPYEGALQQEAVIGIVYAVSAAIGVLVLDRAPQGAEHIKQLLVGTILTVTPQEVAILTALYGAIGALHLLLRRPLLQASLRPQEVPHGRLLLWDALFYVSFALVVTSSVRVAGVLLVFCYLIVPSVAAMLFARNIGPRLAIGWTMGTVVSALGVWLSLKLDLPTGATIVCTFGLVLILMAIVRVLIPRKDIGDLHQVGYRDVAHGGH
jgi:zinc/manganese transport system permease protein